MDGPCERLEPLKTTRRTQRVTVEADDEKLATTLGRERDHGGAAESPVTTSRLCGLGAVKRAGGVREARGPERERLVDEGKQILEVCREDKLDSERGERLSASPRTHLHV